MHLLGFAPALLLLLLLLLLLRSSCRAIMRRCVLLHAHNLAGRRG
jgi:hypothetical protein